MRVAPVLHPARGHCRGDQQRGREEQQAGVSDRTNQQHTEDRAGQPAQAGTRHHQSEQALGLVDREQVHQHAPGQRDRDHVEHRQPDVERACQPHVVGLRQEAECEADEVRGEEAEYPVQDPPPPHARSDPAEQRHRRQRRDESAGKQPLQVVHASGDAHRLAHRPQHEIAGEQQEEQHEAGSNGRDLVVFDVEQAGQPALEHAGFLVLSIRRSGFSRELVVPLSIEGQARG